MYLLEEGTPRWFFEKSAQVVEFARGEVSEAQKRVKERGKNAQMTENRRLGKDKSMKGKRVEERAAARITK